MQDHGHGAQKHSEIITHEDRFWHIYLKGLSKVGNRVQLGTKRELEIVPVVHAERVLVAWTCALYERNYYNIEFFSN